MHRIISSTHRRHQTTRTPTKTAIFKAGKKFRRKGAAPQNKSRPPHLLFLNYKADTTKRKPNPPLLLTKKGQRFSVCNQNKTWNRIKINQDQWKSKHRQKKSYLSLPKQFIFDQNPQKSSQNDLKFNSFWWFPLWFWSSLIHNVPAADSRAKKSGSHRRHVRPPNSSKTSYFLKISTFVGIWGSHMSPMGSAFFRAAEHYELRKSSNPSWNRSFFIIFERNINANKHETRKESNQKYMHAYVISWIKTKANLS